MEIIAHIIAHGVAAATLLLAVALLGAGILILVECAFAFRPASGARPGPTGDASAVAGERAGICVLVPAHDEEDLIDATLDSILPQLTPADRLLVVADNCTDSTAARARNLGAEVIERRDPDLRGKGHALAFGIEHLSKSPPEVLVVVDADCRVREGAIDLLARRAKTLDRPCQAAYLMAPSVDTSPLAAISGFAFRVKNWTRPLGLHRMGLPCPLTGSGMALPWPLVSLVPPDRENVVEDMQLAVDLTRAGRAARFVPEALVTSQLPERTRAAAGQRRRWEHGHMGTLLREGPSLLWTAIRRLDIEGIAFALDLMVPPLSLLALVYGVAVVSTVLAAWLGAVSWLVPVLVGVGLAAFAVGIGLAWHRDGRSIVDGATLIRAPLYVLRKAPLYASFWTRRQREWIRTERRPE